MKLVSIIIPTYNCKKYIKAAIDSCLNQTYRNVEIIVIDDGSTDNTQDILKTYIEEKKIIYIYGSNLGRSHARNIGLKICKGEFIQFVDSDDMIKKTKIQKQMEYLSGNKETFGVFCKTVYFKDDNKDEIIKEFLVKRRGDFYRDLLNENFIPINSMLFRKSNFYFDEALETLEDWDYWLNICLRDNKISYTDESLCYVRVHSNNTTKNAKLMLDGEQKVLKKLLNSGSDPNIDLINYKLSIVYHNLNEKNKSLYYLKRAINLNTKYILYYSLYIIKNSIKKHIIKSKGIYNN